MYVRSCYGLYLHAFNRQNSVTVRSWQPSFHSFRTQNMLVQQGVLEIPALLTETYSIELLMMHELA